MLDFFIVVLCLILNAFFSAYEMAFVTISREEMEEFNETSHTKRKLIAFKKKPERTLSVIQIGITLVGAIAAAVGGTGAVERLEPYLVQTYGLSSTLAEAIAVAVVIIPLTYFSVVFGELVPKTIALKKPAKVIGFGTQILGLIDTFLSPIVSFLEKSTNILLRYLKLNDQGGEDESLGQVVEIGNLPDYHQSFVKNLVALKGRKVSAVMTSWDKTTYLDYKDSEEEIRNKVFSVPYSRFPVIDGDVIVGVLLKKEIPSAEHQNQIPWQGILHPILNVKDKDRVLDAFRLMQQKQIPLSVVTNSEDQYVGLITIEDIIEEIVGDIDDRADYSMTSKILANRAKISFKKS